MAYLLDTNVLVRLGNTVDARHAVAAAAVLELHRRGEVLHITPQVLIEFRNVATRPMVVNGLGLSAAVFEATFPLLAETPDIYPAWKALFVRSVWLANRFMTPGWRRSATSTACRTCRRSTWDTSPDWRGSAPASWSLIRRACEGVGPFHAENRRPSTIGSAEQACGNQFFTQGHSQRGVDFQDADRGAADGRPSAQPCAVPAEMVRPGVAARVKQPREEPRLRINPGEVGPLVSVAVQAGKRQVRRRRPPPVASAMTWLISAGRSSTSWGVRQYSQQPPVRRQTSSSSRRSIGGHASRVRDLRTRRARTFRIDRSVPTRQK